jgi:hypothetical protein
MLMCNVKGCKINNFPLQIKAIQVEKVESEFKPDFIRSLLPKIHWPALVQGAKDVCNTRKNEKHFLKIEYCVIFGIYSTNDLFERSHSLTFCLFQIGVTIPEVLPENAKDDENFLRNLHHVLFDVQILSFSSYLRLIRTVGFCC